MITTRLLTICYVLTVPKTYKTVKIHVLTLICSDSPLYSAYLVAIVNSSVDITTLSTLSVFVAIEMRAEVYGNRSPDPQSSRAFSFALNKAINTREYSRLCVDRFLTVAIKSERRAWRYTSYSTGSTHNYSPRTRDHPTGISSLPHRRLGSVTPASLRQDTSLSSALSIPLCPS